MKTSAVFFLSRIFCFKVKPVQGEMPSVVQHFVTVVKREDKSVATSE